MLRFSDEQIRRYSRQILLREVGGHGQTRLGAARPVLFCPGEVGAVVAEYLWRGGVTELVLLAPTAAAAECLTARLTATGYPGAPARELSTATAALQSLASAAPGFTLLWLPAEDLQTKDAVPTLLWAGGGESWGAMGEGAPALHATAAAQPGAALAASSSGPGAMIIGSALALLTMQKILGFSPVAAPSDAVWRIDLTRAELPAWR